MNIKYLISLSAIAVAIASFTSAVSGYGPGSFATDFKLKNTDNKMVSLSDYKDAKGFIIAFTCNHCPYAKAYEGRIIALDKKYKLLGYPVIAINPNDTVSYPEDSPSEMVKRANEKGYTFPYLFDETQETAGKYGALKTPHIYLLKKVDTQFKVMYTGAIDDNYDDTAKVTKRYLENALDEVIAGKEVTIKSTKAIGCGIKWKQ